MLSLFSGSGNQNMDGWVQCIEISACLYHVPHTMSIYACRMYPKAFGNQQQAAICHELCTVWANKCLVCAGVHRPLGGWGGGHRLATITRGGIYKGAGGLSFLIQPQYL